MKKTLSLLLSILLFTSVFADESYNFWNRNTESENELKFEKKNKQQKELPEEEITEITEAQDEESETEEKTKEKKDFFQRFFEIGIDLDVGVSNSYFNVSDLLKKEIVIDLNEVNDGVGNNGLSFNVDGDTSLYTNIYTKNFNAGLSLGVDINAFAQLEKNLLDLLANGNTLNEEFGVGLGVGASLYAELDANIAMKIGKLKIKATPAFYVPLFYLPYTSASVNATVNEDGSIIAEGGAIASIYSALPLNDFSSFSVNDLLSQGGFDITASAEYPLFSFLDVGVILTHIPVIPSKLNCTNKYEANVTFGVDGMLDQFMTSGAVDFSNFSYSLSDNVATADDTLTLVRPFKIGFNAEWRVFNNKLLILSPLIQFKFADFTLANIVGFGFDYVITAKSDLGIFVPSLTTSYVDSIFSQKLKLAINLRFIELDVIVSSQSANLWKSFAGSGFGAGIGVKIGF